jgi:hypothetical protein
MLRKIFVQYNYKHVKNKGIIIHIHMLLEWQWRKIQLISSLNELNFKSMVKTIHTKYFFQKHSNKELTLKGDQVCNHCIKFMFELYILFLQSIFIINF